MNDTIRQKLAELNNEAAASVAHAADALSRRNRRNIENVYPWLSDDPAPAVIVDVDGTLVDVDGVRHHVTGTTRDFHAFHQESIDCPPIPWVVNLVRDYHHKRYPVVIVTGRSRRYERLTSMWLALHDVPSVEMHMRRDGDQRPDVEVKREILRAVRHRYRIKRAIDDNPSIIDLWKSEGIPVTVVDGP